MRIGDDDIGGAGRFGRSHCGERFARHELAEAPVLEPGRSELIAGHRPGHALHVDGDQHAQSILSTRGRQRGQRGDEQGQTRSHDGYLRESVDDTMAGGSAISTSVASKYLEYADILRPRRHLFDDARTAARRASSSPPRQQPTITTCDGRASRNDTRCRITSGSTSTNVCPQPSGAITAASAITAAALSTASTRGPRLARRQSSAITATPNAQLNARIARRP